ncbi:MAG: hypothetical protein ACLR9P_00725 [Escherichia coli]
MRWVISAAGWCREIIRAAAGDGGRRQFQQYGLTARGEAESGFATVRGAGAVERTVLHSLLLRLMSSIRQQSASRGGMKGCAIQDYAGIAG